MNISHYNLTKNFRDPKLIIFQNNGQINEKAIEYCVLNALGDFTSRTETRINNTAKNRTATDPLGPQEMLADLQTFQNGCFVNEFANYFIAAIKNEPQFDTWHNKMCEIFIACFKGDFVDLQYGKAQKIVNMTFKYIYCLQDAGTIEDYFTHCHMPLDSFTLEWFYRVGKTNKKNIKINNRPMAKKFPSWSKLKYCGNYSNKNYTYLYMDIQNFIRTYLITIENNNCTPLQAEFLIWPQIQFELAAEGFYKQLCDIDNSIKLKDPNTGKDIDFKNLDINTKINWFRNNYCSINFTFIQNKLSTI